MASNILEKILDTKKTEVDQARKEIPLAKVRKTAEQRPREDYRPFEKNLSNQEPGNVAVIAEVKRASPSKGPIRPDLDPAALAASYEKGGAAAISVLTDAPYFMGSLEDLQKARSAVRLPVLRKDFLFCDYQIYEAAATGADAVLLIVRMLSKPLLADLLALAKSLHLGALVEVHSRQDVEVVSRSDATLIGINNRNLATFETDIRIAGQMAEFLGDHQTPVAASGIFSRQDIEISLQDGIQAFLIGESLVRSNNPVSYLKTLCGRG